jgi:predicted nucleic acid-binding protein
MNAENPRREAVDTNILIYAHDPAEPVKQPIAIELIEDLIARGVFSMSVQVLNEFYAVSTRPHRPPSLSHEQAAGIVRDLANSAMIQPLTASVVDRALDAIPRHGFSFWDALVWAAAREDGAAILYTEDFQHGREVEGVRIVNPFETPPA